MYIAAAIPMMSVSPIFWFLRPLDEKVSDGGESAAYNGNDEGKMNADEKHYIELPGSNAVAKPAEQHDKHGEKRQCPPAEKIDSLVVHGILLWLIGKAHCKSKPACRHSGSLPLPAIPEDWKTRSDSDYVFLLSGIQILNCGFGVTVKIKKDTGFRAGLTI